MNISYLECISNRKGLANPSLASTVGGIRVLRAGWGFAERGGASESWLRDGWADGAAGGEVPKGERGGSKTFSLG